MEQHVEWTSPAPWWQNVSDFNDPVLRRAFRTPAILRFAQDEFMDEFLALLSNAPHRLPEYLATPERWDSARFEPTPEVAVTGLQGKLVRLRSAAVARLQARGVRTFSLLPPAAGSPVLKLFQPSHQRYYLVTACLVCRTTGLPDRIVDTSKQERVSFVLRMLRAGIGVTRPDTTNSTELAMVNGLWQPVSNRETLLDGEEIHPLTPATYQEQDGRRRRLFGGLVPVAKRDQLLAATQPNVAGVQPTPLSPVQMQLKIKLFEPWARLEIQAKAASVLENTDPDHPPTAGDKTKAINAANDQMQAVSYYILLDFGDWLRDNLNDLWLEIQNNGTGANLTPEKRSVLQTLNSTANQGTSFRQALVAAVAARTQLEAVTSRYTAGAAGWPAFLFRFVTAAEGGFSGLTPGLSRTTFEQQITDALPVTPVGPQLPVPLVAKANVTPQTPAWFVIRCVLQRPNCPSLSAPLVSEASASFQMASYFDPEAPARPIRIGMPVDTTPAGLRKFDKNTAFVMSDTLCGQVSKMNGLSFGDLIRSVLPFPLHADLDGSDMKPCSESGVGFGMVCSLSIPIITICAFILLMIFIKLLDIVFFWMPFFQICLPLPKFSAKES